MTGERSEDAGNDRADRRTPRWVKLSAGIALAIVLLFALLLLVGSGHGPGRHAGSDAHAEGQELVARPPSLRR